jgi:hypothetical protein
VLQKCLENLERLFLEVYLYAVLAEFSGTGIHLE